MTGFLIWTGLILLLAVAGLWIARRWVIRAHAAEDEERRRRFLDGPP